MAVTVRDMCECVEAIPLDEGLHPVYVRVMREDIAMKGMIITYAMTRAVLARYRSRCEVSPHAVYPKAVVWETTQRVMGDAMMVHAIRYAQ